MVDGRVMTFGFEGVWQGTLAVYEQQTKSTWLQLTGECVDGPMDGRQLNLLPCRHVTWAEWRRDHPDSQVLTLGPGVNTFSRVAVERGGIALPDGFMSTMQERHSAFSQWTLTLGVDVAGESIAYSIADLRTLPGGLLNDTVNGESIVVGAAPETGSPFAFSRIAEGRLLEFGPQSPGRFRDVGTGSVFTHAGYCVSGPLAGTQLRQMQNMQCEWYGWYASRPDTAIWDKTGRIR